LAGEDAMSAQKIELPILPSGPACGGLLAPPARSGEHRVAIAGNPNTGKSLLFNRLTGLHTKVGNYPGVTVERHEGLLRLPSSGQVVRLVDVPGTYSLSARSQDELIAIRELCGLDQGNPPDLVLLVLDGTQLERNLYLALQVIELDLPVVLAVNMLDVLEKSGTHLDAARLSQDLGVPVVGLSAKTGQGLSELVTLIERTLSNPQSARPGWRWIPEDAAFLGALDQLGARLPQTWTGDNPRRTRALALWALLSIDSEDELGPLPSGLREQSLELQARARQRGQDLDEYAIRGRYAWIEARLPRYLRQGQRLTHSTSDRVDRILLNPWIGFPLFLVGMALLFQSLFAWADPLIGAIEAAVAWASEQVSGRLADSIWTSFLVDGVIAGVGGVLVFLPQILLLFLFLGLLEDTGYMARVAYLMDRIMRLVGLNGRAFVPMLSAYACAIPAVLATRTMERRRDRLLTMLVVPLMTCSARLPVYTLLIAALYPVGAGNRAAQGALMVAMYLFSTGMALLVAFVLGRTLLAGPRVPMLLELPPYRSPHLPSVLRQMSDRSLQFIKNAGGIILVCSIALWFLLSFPRLPIPAAGAAVNSVEIAAEIAPDTTAAPEETARTNALEHSYAGRLGRAIEPLIAPLGFDWKIGIGLIGAFAAREVFVSTMAVVYGLEDSLDQDSPRLRERIAGQRRADGTKLFTPALCLSLMVFFALACQCLSTLAVVRQESRSLAWPAFLFVYMTALAWLSSFVLYQGAGLLGFA
jgi:ferrous iron transport protein B